MDGCGAGAAPDAADFGDTDPSTIQHTWEAVGGIEAPNLEALGFFAACGVEGKSKIEYPNFKVAFGRLKPLSKGGKDSVVGHWEMMGIVLDESFPTYPDGFPISLVKEFEQAIETQTLGNRAASGTKIIEELGRMHVETGFPILYTSADSVFQIACHEDVVPIDKLYGWCEIARKLCVSPNNIERVIARPFVGDSSAGFKRTGKRKDFVIPAPSNLIDEIGDVYGIGVVPELFSGRGFRSLPRSQSNLEHWIAMEDALSSDARFIFANFEDFDMLYGHRNDPEGFARCLAEFDGQLGFLFDKLTTNDLLILTADHGNDPTDESTDHTREYAPIVTIKRAPSLGTPLGLGDADGYSAVGTTVAQHLGITWKVGGTRL